MQKTILITGSTDGIGLATAEKLVAQGHKVLVHGRSPKKLEAVAEALNAQAGDTPVESYVADLSNMQDVEALAKAVMAKHQTLDVLINNAGVFKTPEPITADGLDVRFAVNTVAPYLLTRRLLPLMNATGRIVNLSSAAQASVNIQAIAGGVKLADMDAYSQSKLAITMWTRHLATEIGEAGPVVVAVNPASLLASKMVKEGFGMAGNDINIGVDILIRAALADEFADATGKYFDNDAKCFANPQADGLDDAKSAEIVDAIKSALAKLGSTLDS